MIEERYKIVLVCDSASCDRGEPLDDTRYLRKTEKFEGPDRNACIEAARECGWTVKRRVAMGSARCLCPDCSDKTDLVPVRPSLYAIKHGLR